MDQIINSLSEIEAKTRAVMDDAGDQKKVIDAQMQAQTEAFDKKIEQDTSERIMAIREEMDQRAKAELGACRQETNRILNALSATYEANHTALAKELFSQMTEG